MFTLKVISSEKAGTVLPDDKHANGGIDILQRQAFLHLAPLGYQPHWQRELLYNLVELHGWRLQITNDEGVINLP